MSETEEHSALIWNILKEKTKQKKNKKKIFGYEELTKKRECDILYENEKLAKVGNSFKKGGMPDVFIVLITKPFYCLDYKAILLGKLELMKISLSFPDYYPFSCGFYNSLRSVVAVFFN